MDEPPTSQTTKEVPPFLHFPTSSHASSKASSDMIKRDSVISLVSTTASHSCHRKDSKISFPQSFDHLDFEQGRVLTTVTSAVSTVASSSDLIPTIPTISVNDTSNNYYGYSNYYGNKFCLGGAYNYEYNPYWYSLPYQIYSLKQMGIHDLKKATFILPVVPVDVMGALTSFLGHYGYKKNSKTPEVPKQQNGKVYTNQIPMIVAGEGVDVKTQTLIQVEKIDNKSQIANDDLLGKNPASTSVFVDDGKSKVDFDRFAVASKLIHQELGDKTLGVLSIHDKKGKSVQALQGTSMTIYIARDLNTPSIEQKFYVFSAAENDVSCFAEGSVVKLEFDAESRFVRKCAIEKVYRHVYMKSHGDSGLGSCSSNTLKIENSISKNHVAPGQPNSKSFTGIEIVRGISEKHAQGVEASGYQIFSRITRPGQIVELSGIRTLYEYVTVVGKRGSFLNVKGVDKQDSMWKCSKLLDMTKQGGESAGKLKLLSSKKTDDNGRRPSAATTSSSSSASASMSQVHYNYPDVEANRDWLWRNGEEW